MSVESSYTEIKRLVDEYRTRADEWLGDLERDRYSGRREMKARILIIEAEPSVSEELTSVLAGTGFVNMVASLESLDVNGSWGDELWITGDGRIGTLVKTMVWKQILTYGMYPN